MQKATDAKTYSDEAQIKERIQLAYHSALVGGQGSYTKDTLMEELKKEFETDYDVDDSDNTNWILSAKGQSVTIPAEKKTLIEKFSSSDVASKADEFYGLEVINFTSENGYSNWKLFYANSTNIYLIASDYISYSSSLKGKNGHSFLQGKSSVNYKFGTNASTGVMQDYPQGTAEIVDTNYATADTIKSLNSKYFATFPTKQTQYNKRAMASMLDTNVWKSFMDTSDLSSVTRKAQYAIGGPTVEMFFNSYNKKYNLYNDQNKEKYQLDVPSENNSGVGYKLSIDYGSTYIYTMLNSSEVLNTNDTLYINQPNTSHAEGYWLASPPAGLWGRPGDSEPASLMTVNYNGEVTHMYYGYTGYAFRPIVCLRNEVRLEKTEDGKCIILDFD